MTDPLVLYVEAYWSSPWTCAAYVALRERELPFSTSLSMTGPGIGARDAMRKHTLTGTAPVLQHGSFWIAESSAIIEYLEEAFPPPTWPALLPDDIRDRGRARQLMSWVRTSLGELSVERPFEHVLYRVAAPPAPLSATAQRTADELIRVAERLGAAASSWLFGDRFGIVDVDIACALMRLVGAGAQVPATVAAYAESVWNRPSVREFVEHQRPPNLPNYGR